MMKWANNHAGNNLPQTCLAYCRIVENLPQTCLTTHEASKMAFKRHENLPHGVLWVLDARQVVLALERHENLPHGVLWAKQFWVAFKRHENLPHGLPLKGGETPHAFSPYWWKGQPIMATRNVNFGADVRCPIACGECCQRYSPSGGPGPCEHLGQDGCTLPRYSMPQICRWYLCTQGTAAAMEGCNAV